MRDWYRSKSLDERRAMREQRDTERVRADDRARHEREKADATHAVKRRARTAVSNAIRDGRLTRRPCYGCGCEAAQAHHDDYSKPLDVRWLCTTCHAAEHAPEARAA